MVFWITQCGWQEDLINCHHKLHFFPSDKLSVCLFQCLPACRLISVLLDWPWYCSLLCLYTRERGNVSAEELRMSQSAQLAGWTNQVNFSINSILNIAGPEALLSHLRLVVGAAWAWVCSAIWRLERLERLERLLLTDCLYCEVWEVLGWVFLSYKINTRQNIPFTDSLIIIMNNVKIGVRKEIKRHDTAERRGVPKYPINTL